MKTKRVVVVLACVAALMAIVAGLVVWQPWANGDGKGEAPGEAVGDGANAELPASFEEEPSADDSSEGGMTDEEWADAMRIVREQLNQQESLEPKDIPAALAAARDVNPDVIAWLWVPGTNVTLPVCRHPSDNSYYALHDASGELSPVGAAFVEKENSPNFDDPVTVVNGHTYGDISEQICFAQLHYLLGAETFNQTELFYVYLPDRVLSYQMISALVFNDSPILASSDYFVDEEVTQAYFDFVTSGEALLGQVRKGISLNASEDCIVQLVTCELSVDGTARLVVTGRLAGEEPL